MGKLHDNSGFTLIEMLVVLSAVTIVTVLIQWRISELKVVYDNPIHCQIEAMAYKKRCQWKDGLHFNENGNINHAQTIRVNGKLCVFQLGMGRFKCE